MERTSKLLLELQASTLEQKIGHAESALLDTLLENYYANKS
jgi:hypothetical protein